LLKLPLSLYFVCAIRHPFDEKQAKGLNEKHTFKAKLRVCFNQIKAGEEKVN